jgi:hypothetical protein
VQPESNFSGCPQTDFAAIRSTTKIRNAPHPPRTTPFPSKSMPPPSSPSPTYQAHEIVYCSKCSLPYDTAVNITQYSDLSKDAYTRTWYLTRCSHVLCSSCLFPNGGIAPRPAQTRGMLCGRPCGGVWKMVMVVPERIEEDTLYTCPTCHLQNPIIVLSYEVPSVLPAAGQLFLTSSFCGSYQRTSSPFSDPSKRCPRNFSGP